MFEVKLIDRAAVYPLRHAILRPHRPYDEIIYESDSHPKTFHVGAFYQGELISVASFNPEECSNIQSKQQFRLRAMATRTDFRKQGAGKAIVSFAEAKLKADGVEVLWCKGRTTVQGYYESIGFKAFGEVFEYPTLGPHIILFKHL